MGQINVYDLRLEQQDQRLRRNFHGSSQDGSSERVLADAAGLDEKPVQCATIQETGAVPSPHQVLQPPTHSEWFIFHFVEKRVHEPPNRWFGGSLERAIGWTSATRSLTSL